MREVWRSRHGRTNLRQILNWKNHHVWQLLVIISNNLEVLKKKKCQCRLHAACTVFFLEIKNNSVQKKSVSSVCFDEFPESSPPRQVWQIFPPQALGPMMSSSSGSRSTDPLKICLFLGARCVAICSVSSCVKNANFPWLMKLAPHHESSSWAVNAGLRDVCRSGDVDSDSSQKTKAVSSENCPTQRGEAQRTLMHDSCTSLCIPRQFGL